MASSPLLCLLCVAVAAAGVAATSLSAAAPVCDVVAYGAKGDGVSDDTQAIQAALTECAATSGATVVFTALHHFRTGPLTVPAKTQDLTLVFAASTTLHAFDDITTWPVTGGGYQHFLSIGAGSRNLHIRGEDGSVLDGAGAAWWDAFKKDELPHHRPHLLLIGGDNIGLDVRGITLRNSPCFHLVVLGSSSHLLIDGVRIDSPAYDTAPNTDGIDLFNCRHCIVRNSVINNGDDGIAIKSGSGGATKDVLIENIEFGHCLGATLGTSDHVDVSDVLWRNLRFNGAGYGPRIKYHLAQSSASPGVGVRNVTYEDVTLNNVLHGLSINTYNQLAPDAAAPASVDVHDVTFRRVRGTGTSSAGHFWCSPDRPCHDIVLEDVDLPGASPFSCVKAHGSATHVSPSASCLS